MSQAANWDISVNWQGAAKAYSFDEVIVDSNGKKLDMRFGGNLTAAEEKKTGCLVCLDSCPVGIVSNATYTYGAVEKRGEVKFKGNAQFSRRITRWQRLPLKSPNKAG